MIVIKNKPMLDGLKKAKETVMFFIKILNPIIWLLNFINYMSHVENYRGKKYQPYDFSKEIKYF